MTPRAEPIRDYAAGDADALYDVCLRTGDDGRDATALYTQPSLLASVYVGPYLAFQPQLAMVLDDGAGAEGYVLGALDTRAFEQTCEQQWWPVLRERYPLGTFRDGSPDATLVAVLHAPPTAPGDVVAAYPSHLHIDLLPRWQGGGWGRRLIEALLQRLAEQGSAGVHLGVSVGNERAIGFYRRLGFEDLAPTHFGLYMGRRLDSGRRLGS